MLDPAKRRPRRYNRPGAPMAPAFQRFGRIRGQNRASVRLLKPPNRQGSGSPHGNNIAHITMKVQKLIAKKARQSQAPRDKGQRVRVGETLAQITTWRGTA